MLNLPPKLSLEDFEYLVPFHLHWDNEGNVLGISSGLRRFWHDPSEEELSQVLLVRPFRSSEVFKLLPDLTDMVLLTCHVCCECGLHNLRCEVRDLGDAGWLLVGQPDVSQIKDLEALGFYLSDLPLHIGLGDLLIANEAAQVSLDDARAVEAKLRETNQSVSSLNTVFRRFVPSRFLENLGVESMLDLELGRHVEMHGTVMFADMHGFTSISEAVGAKSVFRIINQYLAAIVPCIERFGGVVVHYQGDGVIALFPGNDGSAIDAAIGMQRALKWLNTSGGLEDSPRELCMSIGIHDGTVTLGIVGDSTRWDASIISDAVNTSARIESLTRLIGGEILMSRSCLDGATRAQEYKTRSLGEHTIRGRKERLELVEILDALQGSEWKKRETTEEHYQKGRQALSEGDIYTAMASFREVLLLFPNDKASQFFLSEAMRQLSRS